MSLGHEILRRITELYTLNMSSMVNTATYNKNEILPERKEALVLWADHVEKFTTRCIAVLPCF